jgi:hypothetical protein
MESMIFRKSVPDRLEDAVRVRVADVFNAYDKTRLQGTDMKVPMPAWLVPIVFVYAGITIISIVVNLSCSSPNVNGVLIAANVTLSFLHLFVILLVAFFVEDMICAARVDSRLFAPAADSDAPMDVYVTMLVRDPVKQRKFEELQHTRRGALRPYQGRFAGLTLRELQARVPGAVADVACADASAPIEEQAEAVTKRVFFLALSEV